MIFMFSQFLSKPDKVIIIKIFNDLFRTKSSKPIENIQVVKVIFKKNELRE